MLRDPAETLLVSAMPAGSVPPVIRKRPSALSGFSILESLVVLLVITLLASIVIPALRMKAEEEASPKPAPAPQKESGAGSEVTPREQANAGKELREALAED